MALEGGTGRIPESIYMQNKKWIFLCVLGGLLMIVGSLRGNVILFKTVFNIMEKLVGDRLSTIFSIILVVLEYIAKGGGFSVIAGTCIVIYGHYTIGKLVIAVGAGMGIIGLILFIIAGLLSGSLIHSFLSGDPGFFGVILTIIGRLKLRK